MILSKVRRCKSDPVWHSEKWIQSHETYCAICLCISIIQNIGAEDCFALTFPASFLKTYGEPATSFSSQIHVWQLHICTFGRWYTFARGKQPLLMRCLDTESKHFFYIVMKSTWLNRLHYSLLCHDWMWLLRVHFLDIPCTICFNFYLVWAPNLTIFFSVNLKGMQNRIRNIS